MEIIDIVDENDEMVDKRPRKEAHERGLLHRGAAIIVHTPHREMVLQKRSEDKMKKPGKLCVPGGHLEAGDSYREGAIREFFEELYSKDYGAIELEELFKIRKDADDDPEFMKVFRAEDTKPFNPDSSEVQKLVFWSPEKLSEELEKRPEQFTQTTRIILKELYQRKGSFCQ